MEDGAQEKWWKALCVCVYTVTKLGKLLSMIWSLAGKGKRVVY